MRASCVVKGLVTLGSLRGGNTHFLRGVEPEECTEGVEDNLSGMLYFLRIGVVPKMHDIFHRSDRHEENSARHCER